MALLLVIYQRQAQKSNLALAISKSKSKRSSKDASARFTDDELRDCFTLKHCACDTKNKIGTNWGKYGMSMR